jgi:hypothetical protein
MARKTWVKLKRGLLIDPQHRLALGNRIWLYLFMLDVTDWDTGKILEWRDKDAADELDMPLVTVRNQRREIEEAGYISCKQMHRRQEITIKRWVNPREYSGKVYNTDGYEWDVDMGDDFTAPKEKAQKSNGDVNGVNHGVNHGDQNLTPLHINHTSHITDQGIKDNGLFEACSDIYKALKRSFLPTHDFADMVKRFQQAGVIAEDYYKAIEDQDAKGGYGDQPTSYEKWTLGIADKRLNPPKVNTNRPPRTPAEIAAWNEKVLNELAEEY